ncbi:Nicotinamidase-related amidase [Clostridium cavendishii DSM 21758]|uniref:Nicotinamidase-related amidase n=1 Tax=Clostridium cavendishii DSM 21758 TaxID=1121302 RepID=A0A1M6SX04_9CLOT|nr:isochorismatase family cysteine hydrolase [Clostridium cavendishii]SHK49224.1 Nicotinamidase-related amidase [Clostridium cavendishii DSM 21758]
MIEILENIKKELEELDSIKLEEITKGKTDKTAIIVVDMVKGFYNVGALASPRVEAVIEPIINLVKANDKLNKVFFVDSHTESSEELKCYPAHCIENTEEEELIEEINELTKGDKNIAIIKKNSINGFHAPDFKKWFEQNSEIENFIVTGVCTNICVETFVMSLITYFNQFNLNKKIIVPMNTVETYDFGNHNAELMNMMSFFKMKSNGVILVKEILK